MYVLNVCNGIVIAENDVILGSVIFVKISFYSTAVDAVCGDPHKTNIGGIPFQSFDVYTGLQCHCIQSSLSPYLNEWSGGQLVLSSSAFMLLS